MVPIYSLTNLCACIWYHKAVYFGLAGNAYAAIGLASFYQLLTAYVQADIHRQKEYFRSIKPKPWGWPIKWLPARFTEGILRTPRSGLTFYNVRVSNHVASKS